MQALSISNESSRPDQQVGPARLFRYDDDYSRYAGLLLVINCLGEGIIWYRYGDCSSSR